MGIASKREESAVPSSRGRRQFVARAASAAALGLVHARPARALSSLYGDMIKLEDHIDVSTTHDVGPVITALSKAYPGRPFLLTNRQFQLRSKAIVDGPPLTILGMGSGIGPGPAAQNYQTSSAITIFFGGDDAISVTSLNACVFRDFQMDVWPDSRVGPGACLKLSGPPNATNAGSEFSNVAFLDRAYGLHLLRPFKPLVQKCYFDTWRKAGVFFEADAHVEGTGGEIRDSVFFGASLGSGVLSEIGYVDIHENHFLGGRNGVCFAFAKFPAGAPRVYRNNIEENLDYGVLLTSADGAKSAMVDVSENEFSNIDHRKGFRAHIAAIDHPSGDSFESLRIVGNTMRSILETESCFISIQTRALSRIEANTLLKLGAGDCVGLEVLNAGPSPHHASDNEMNSLPGATAFVKYRAEPDTLRIIDVGQGTTFDRLEIDYRDAADGSEVLVTDGRRLSPITGGGTGARAFRVGQRWLA